MANPSVGNIIRQSTGLLNANKYDRTITVSITASAAAVTSTDSPFASTDVGKSIAIAGAGTSGGIHQSTISAYTNANSITISSNAVTTVANAACTFGGQMDDDYRTLQEVLESMHESDEEIITAIMDNPNHWARADLVSLSSSITHAAQLPAHIGNVTDVLISNVSGDAYIPGIRLTRPDAINYIQRLRTNAGSVYGAQAHNASGTMIAGRWVVDADNYLYYTGFDAKAYLYNYSRVDNTLKSPIAYSWALVAGLVGKLYAKEGDDLASADWYLKQQLGYLQLIRSGVESLGGLQVRGAVQAA